MKYLEMPQTNFFPWKYMCTERANQTELKRAISTVFAVQEDNKGWSHWLRPNVSKRIVKKSKLKVAFRKYNMNKILLRQPAGII